MRQVLLQACEPLRGLCSSLGIVANPLFEVGNAAFQLGNAKPLFRGRGVELPRQLVALDHQAIGFGQARQQRRDIHFPPGELLGLFRERGFDIRNTILAGRELLVQCGNPRIQSVDLVIQVGDRPAQLADFRLPPFDVGAKLDVGAEGFEQLIDDRRIVAAESLRQLTEGGRHLVADQQDPQAMRMAKLERRIALGQFGPQLPHPEAASALHGVVEEDDARRRHLRQPGLEIVLDRLVGVQAIDVQQVDAAVAELVQGIVERGAHEVREAGEMTVVDGAEFGEDFFAVGLRVLVALPGVHRIANGLQAALFDGLAERQVGCAAMGAELDEYLRPQRIHQPTRERDVAGPGACGRVPGVDQHAGIQHDDDPSLMHWGGGGIIGEF